ncbi:MAG: hypothetical protein M3N08_08480 [Pseudomonadota bacterium]|nr:hypothetical protein [Pseudomonadota bacterium]
MDFIRRNPALALGIGLPCLVVVLFSLAALIPAWIVPPPQYDALFATTGSAYTASDSASAELKFTVEKNHLKLYRRRAPKQGGLSDTKLFRFDARTGSVSEISVPPPGPAEPISDAWQPLEVPDTQALVLDTRTTAPDGYQFHDRSPGYNGGLWPFFDGMPARENVTVSKDGRQIKVPLAEGNLYYTGGPIRLLGWITGGR